MLMDTPSRGSTQVISWQAFLETPLAIKLAQTQVLLKSATVNAVRQRDVSVSTIVLI